MTQPRKQGGSAIPVWLIGDVDNATIRFDEVTGVPITMSYEHHEIHDGSTFRVQVNNQGASAATLNMAFRVKDQSKAPHMVFTLIATSTGYIELIEGATWDSESGTRVVMKNSNRNSAKTSILEEDSLGAWNANGVAKDVTNITGGTVISRKDIFSATAPQGFGGGGVAERPSEIVLKPGETYILRFTSTDGDQEAQIRYEAYEHTSRA